MLASSGLALLQQYLSQEPRTGNWSPSFMESGRSQLAGTGPIPRLIGPHTQTHTPTRTVGKQANTIKDVICGENGNQTSFSHFGWR